MSNNSVIKAPSPALTPGSPEWSLIRSISIHHPDFVKKKEEFMFILLMGMCLSFCTGFMNGCALSGFGGRSLEPMSIAGVTGVYTKMATKFMQGWTSDSNAPAGAGTSGLNLLGSICCYIGGAMIPGAMLHKRKPWALEPEYGPCFLICALLLSAASVTAEEDANGIVYYLLLCAVSGLQNGMSSTFSANLIRSSHLSGTTTDIGLIIGQKLRGTHTNTWKLQVLILLTLSFFLGGIVAFPASKYWGFHAIIVNVSVFTVIGIAACYDIVKQYGISTQEFLFGTQYKWEKVLQGLDITTDAHILELIEKINFTKDDIITEEGLDTFFKQAGLHVNRKYLNILIADADTDGDGFLSKKEMFVVLQKTRFAMEADAAAKTGSKFPPASADNEAPPVAKDVEMVEKKSNDGDDNAV